MTRFESAMDRADNVIFSTFTNTNAFFSFNGVVVKITGVLDKAFSESLDVPGFIPIFSYKKANYQKPLVGMKVQTEEGDFEVVSFDDDLSGMIILHLKQL